MSKYSDIWSSISSVLEGNPTKDDEQRFNDWMKENKNNELFFNNLKDNTYNESIEEKAHASKESIYLKTQSKINQIDLRLKLRIWRSIAAASIALFLIAGSIAFFKTETNNPVNSVLVESTCPTGTTTKLTLNDGTVVVLNANSTIAYPMLFDKEIRNVKLEGEAYFEVAKDAERPFIVEANAMKINVLGTHFNVKSYSDDKKTFTTLLEGSVSVELVGSNGIEGKSIILCPGQQIIVDRTTMQTEVINVNADLYSTWKDGQCFFENERFVDIAKKLERQFGITITINSPGIENQLYSGFFGKKDGVLHILNSFKKHRNFDYKQSDTGIEIYEK